MLQILVFQFSGAEKKASIFSQPLTRRRRRRLAKHERSAVTIADAVTFYRLFSLSLSPSLQNFLSLYLSLMQTLSLPLSVMHTTSLSLSLACLMPSLCSLKKPPAIVELLFKAGSCLSSLNSTEILMI